MNDGIPGSMVDLFHSNDGIAGLDLHLIRFDVGTLGTNMGLILPMDGMPGLHMGLIHADDAFGQSIHKNKLERVLKASTLRPSSSIDNNQSGIKALSFYGETLFGHLYTPHE